MFVAYLITHRYHCYNLPSAFRIAKICQLSRKLNFKFPLKNIIVCLLPNLYHAVSYGYEIFPLNRNLRKGKCCWKCTSVKHFRLKKCMFSQHFLTQQKQRKKQCNELHQSNSKPMHINTHTHTAREEKCSHTKG